MKRKSLLTLSVVLCASAQAALITSDPGGGTTTTFTTTGFTVGTPGPAVVDGLTITGVFNYGNAGYGLNSNGSWSGFSWVAVDDPTGFFRIDLGGLFGFAGAAMNYALISGLPVGDNPVIRAIAADGSTILETYDLFTNAPISTPSATNGTAFRGIQRGTADIRYFEIGNAYSIAHSITTGGAAPVPEPTTWAMMVTGLGLLGFLRKKQG